MGPVGAPSPGQQGPEPGPHCTASGVAQGEGSVAIMLLKVYNLCLLSRANGLHISFTEQLSLKKGHLLGRRGVGEREG